MVNTFLRTADRRASARSARSVITAAVSTVLACAALSGIAEAQSFGRECVEFGTPSFTATRELDTGKDKFSSKIFVSGERQREETVIGKGVNVRILKDGTVTIFDTVKKTGIRLPQRPAEAGGPAQVSESERRVTREQKGDITRIITQRKRGDDWLVALVVDCRSDGVLMGSTFPAPGPDGQLLYQSFRHVDITVGPVDEALFEVPADIKLTTPPPGPPPAPPKKK